MKPTVYIETTIISYLTAWPSKNIVRRSHEIITANWWKDARPRFDLYTSAFTLEEASAGDADAAKARLRVLKNISVLPLLPQARTLADRLTRALKLPDRARIDASHVAVAASHKITFLLTWNCRHLANGALTDKIERACAEFDLVAPRILTPELLLELP